MNAVTKNMYRIKALEDNMQDMCALIGGGANPNKDVVKSIMDLRTQVHGVKATQSELQIQMENMVNEMATFKNDSTIMLDNIRKELTHVYNALNSCLADNHSLAVASNTTQPSEPLKQYVVDTPKPLVPPDTVTC